MRTSVLMCFPVILASNTPVSAQPQNQDVDTSQWQCKWCPGDERKVEADVKGGLGYVTNDSYKFGDYTGLNEKGVYVLADADASGRNEKGAYFADENVPAPFTGPKNIYIKSLWEKKKMIYD